MNYFYNPNMGWVIGLASTPLCLATQNKSNKFVAHLNSVSYHNLMRIFESLDDYDNTVFLEIPFLWKYFKELHLMVKEYFSYLGAEMQNFLACDLSKMEEAIFYYADMDKSIDDRDDYFAKDLCYKFIQDSLKNAFMLFMIKRSRNKSMIYYTIDQLKSSFPIDYSHFESYMNERLVNLPDIELDEMSKDVLQVLSSRQIFDFDYISAMLLDNFGLDTAMEDITNEFKDEEDFALINCNVLNSGYDQQYFSNGVVLTKSQKERYLEAIKFTKFYEILPQKYKDAYDAEDSLLITIEPVHYNTIRNIVEKYHYEYFTFFKTPFVKTLKERINDTEQLTNDKILADFTLLKKVKDVRVSKFSEMFVEILENARNKLDSDYFTNLFLGRELYLPVTRDFLTDLQSYEMTSDTELQSVYINPVNLN